MIQSTNSTTPAVVVMLSSIGTPNLVVPESVGPESEAGSTARLMVAAAAGAAAMGALCRLLTADGVAAVDRRMVPLADPVLEDAPGEPRCTTLRPVPDEEVRSPASGDGAAKRGGGGVRDSSWVDGADMAGRAGETLRRSTADDTDEPGFDEPGLDRATSA